MGGCEVQPGELKAESHSPFIRATKLVPGAQVKTNTGRSFEGAPNSCGAVVQPTRSKQDERRGNHHNPSNDVPFVSSERRGLSYQWYRCLWLNKFRCNIEKGKQRAKMEGLLDNENIWNG